MRRLTLLLQRLVFLLTICILLIDVSSTLLALWTFIKVNLEHIFRTIKQCPSQ